MEKIKDVTAAELAKFQTAVRNKKLEGLEMLMQLIECYAFWNNAEALEIKNTLLPRGSMFLINTNIFDVPKNLPRGVAYGNFLIVEREKVDAILKFKNAA